MNYDAIRDAIEQKLLSVPGIGKVFPHLRFSADLKTFMDLFTVPHPTDPTKKIPSVTFITRIGPTNENPLWTEDETVAAVESDESWHILLLYGFYDDEDSEAASETHFHRLVDLIQDEFRFDDRLGIPNVVAGPGRL